MKPHQPWSKTRLLYPGDYSPPKGDRSFYVLFHGLHKEAVSVDQLSDERLSWVARVITAEIKRRQSSVV